MVLVNILLLVNFRRGWDELVQLCGQLCDVVVVVVQC